MHRLIFYHGTSVKVAAALVSDPMQLDVALGGGELGQGFYTSDEHSLEMVARWAQLRDPEEGGAVVAITVDASAYVRLSYRLFRTVKDVEAEWIGLKRKGLRKTRRYGVDVVIGPMATWDARIQRKFESSTAERLLKDSFWEFL